MWARSTTTARNTHWPKSIIVPPFESDPRYALAYFDLGNVLDETGRVQEAIQTYKTALQLAPTYADAHYNLALAYEKLKQPRKALPHWQCLRQARYRQPLGRPCPQPDSAHPAG